MIEAAEYSMHEPSDLGGPFLRLGAGESMQ